MFHTFRDKKSRETGWAKQDEMEKASLSGRMGRDRSVWG
ncbi:hypothetical protein JCM19237_1542 [Photobacterium aphoticum]|uniref:Uncharacterized protein n=1 Tax=Photobacterium aphoticum TaxID=754436 RepID=A0A090REA3_9GAMM|nr:hypothetical protein JCM19237_1542 [Photobacterium aphoticum]